jgi:Ca2+-binding RTX toxin-like protein
VTSSVTFTLSANVESLILTGKANTNGTGSVDDNTITGNSGNNLLSGAGGNDVLVGGLGNDALDGGAGNDTMTGGLGNDTYAVDSVDDVVTELKNQGTDTVLASIGYVLGADVENLTLIGKDDTTGIGNGLANVITGNSGNNTLMGGIGADKMAGGTGNDAYEVDNAGDKVTESIGEGIDEVQSSISYTLGANVENLTLSGGGNLNGTGNDLDNTIIGTLGNNKLTGGKGHDSLEGVDGNDTLSGGDGNDTLSGGDGIDSLDGGNGNDAVDGFLGNDKLVGGAGNDTLTGGDNNDSLDGGVGNDSLDGGAGNDVLVAGDGDDTLTGGSGLDKLSGGKGNDTYVIVGAGSTLTEVAGQGTDTVVADQDFALAVNFENLTLTGLGDLTGTGNTVDNVIIGNEGNNTLLGLAGNDSLQGDQGDDSLDGGAGNDTMSGGNGDDIYFVDSTGDTVAEQPGDGFDSVFASASFTLGANVEELTLVGAANLAGTGGADDNGIFGNLGNNTLSGAGGNDTLLGGGGTDTLLGGEGDDTLIGGDGVDTLTGDAGIDTFDFNSLNGSVDVITDFDTGEGGDILDLSDLLIGFDEGADNLGDFVQFVQQGADTLIQVNADGTGVDFVDVALLQNVTLTLGAAVADGNITPDGIV